MDANDLSILAALMRDFDGVRNRLSETDRRELDRLLAMFADRPDEQGAEAIGAAVVLHLMNSLPGDERQRLRLQAPGVELDRGVLRELAAVFGYRRPAAGPPEDGPSAPAAGGTPWERIRTRLLSEASLSEEQVELHLGQDPWHRHLIRLTDATGEVRLPTFQFGPDGTPLPVVLSINEELRADVDPWGVADWWLGRNHWLDTPPARALGRVPDDELIAVARTVGEGY
ncbi:DUF3168 domain-containing protein [Streptomyces sp. NPDC046716]|uniref:DUF3168 domain-containing protein n=1 Tax=Streptomyces sp. NPDC046716 TaxID=3157093 RepID=UPI0033D95194